MIGRAANGKATLELVVFVGLPGAGKSSFFRARFAATHVHASKDLWPNARRPEARLLREVEAALCAGRSVVVDNVNATTAARAGVIALAKAHGAAVTGYFFDVDVATARARNDQRTGRAKVPPVAIHAAAKDLERPLLAEGFDRLFVVRDGRVVEYRR